MEGAKTAPRRCPGLDTGPEALAESCIGTKGSKVGGYVDLCYVGKRNGRERPGRALEALPRTGRK